MKTISRKELIDIAQISGLEVNDDEYALFAEEIESVLSYIKELASITITDNQECNDIEQPMMREDVAYDSNSDAYQAQTHKLINNAPVSEDTYFVVPKMIQKTRS